MGGCSGLTLVTDDRAEVEMLNTLRCFQSAPLAAGPEARM